MAESPSPPRPTEPLGYERAPVVPGPRPGLLGLSIVLLIATAVTLVGLLLTIASTALIIAHLSGEPEAPVFVAYFTGPIGLIFLPGGGYVMWRAIRMMRRRRRERPGDSSH